MPVHNPGGVIGSLTGGTAGSVLFVGSGGVLAQDNTNFFWDDTNDELRIGGATTQNAKIVSAAAAADAYNLYIDSSTNLATGASVVGAQINLTSANIASTQSLYGSVASVTNTNSLNGASEDGSILVQAFQGLVTNNVDHPCTAGFQGPSETNRGVLFNVSRAGTITTTGGYFQNNYGTSGSINNSTTFNNAAGVYTVNNYGVHAGIQAIGSLTAGALTRNNYGVYVTVNTNAIGTTTNYGIYLAQVSAGDTDWAYYNNTAADNFLGLDNSLNYLGTGRDVYINYTGTVWDFDIALATSEIVFNNSGFDTDFRIETDNQAEFFFVDAGNNELRIGNGTTKNAKLVVTGEAADFYGLYLDNTTNPLTSSSVPGPHTLHVTATSANTGNASVDITGSYVEVVQANAFTGSQDGACQATGQSLTVTNNASHSFTPNISGVVEQNIAQAAYLTRNGTLTCDAIDMFNYGVLNVLTNDTTYNKAAAAFIIENTPHFCSISNSPTITNGAVVITNQGYLVDIVANGTLTAGTLTRNNYGSVVNITSNAIGTTTNYGSYLGTITGGDANWGYYNNSTAAHNFLGRDNVKTYWGTGSDVFIQYTGTVWDFDVALATTEIVFNNSGIDTNFRIESDNQANLFYLDAGLEEITIGSTTSLGLFGIDGFEDQIQFRVQAYSSQTADIAVIENSSGTDLLAIGARGQFTHSPSAAATGTPADFLYSNPAHTTLTKADFHHVYFNLGAATSQFASGGGTISTVRALRINAPTYGAATNALTITDGSTVYIDNHPATGTNVSYTRRWALNVNSGVTKLGGGLRFSNGGNLWDDTTLSYGVYSPTPTLQANMNNVNTYETHYYIVGGCVTVAGKMDVDVAAGGVQADFTIDTPLGAMSWGADQYCAGVGYPSDMQLANGFAVQADTVYTGSDILFRAIPNDAGNRTLYFTFTFRVF